ncbi:DUF4157 domain-containing protein [Streptomyces sp. NPDC058694]|uniref:eCIS core domain-containing protein n=1 Tax=Streptomyces sp. NPDC058694 TaxID=3346603 RepID=UPI0036502F44
MRAHAARADKADDRKDARRPAGPSASANRLLTLQRLAGNAAVSRAVEEERHEHGPGCAHERPAAGQQSVQRDASETVQREASVSDALNSPGSSLDSRIREKAEQAYGMDFGHVRVHTDAVAQRSAAALGALAYTTGSDIVVGPQGATDEMMFHEIDHVHQQSMGPVAGTDNGSGAKVSHPDDPFERRSAANGRKLASGGAPDLAHPVQRAAGGRLDPVQRVHHGGSAAVDRPVRQKAQKVKNLPLYISEPEYSSASPSKAGGKRAKAILGPRSYFGMGTDADARLPRAIDDARSTYNIGFKAGHLLNADFGGNGRIAQNLTILTPSANNRMQGFDDPIKSAVGYLHQIYESLAGLYVPIDRLRYGISVRISVSGPDHVWDTKYPGNCISAYIHCNASVYKESDVMAYYNARDPHDGNDATWDYVLGLMSNITAFVARANNSDLIDNEP